MEIVGIYYLTAEVEEWLIAGFLNKRMSTHMISIKIENCRNISSAEITLNPNALNIRYAMNGTGKTTIAKAIQALADGQDLGELKTFGGELAPVCNISSPFRKVLTFNEEFVSTIVFQASEVIRNAFEIFIRSPDYDEKQQRINERLRALNINTAENPEYEVLLKTGEAVLSKFTKTASGQFRKTGLIKALTSSESIFKLPEKLQKFQPLMNKDYKVEWVGWKSEGAKYDDNNICPFCTSAFDDHYPQEKQLFTESYTKSNVRNITEMLGYFEAVEEYMPPEKREAMSKCIRESADEETVTKWVTDFYNDLEFLVHKIKKIVEFNAYHVKQEEISGLADKLAQLIIEPETLVIFNSEKTIQLVCELNERIRKVASEVDVLKQDIGSLKGFINTALQKAIGDVNEFLDMACIDYVLDIHHVSEHETRTLLKYKPRDKDLVVVDDIKKSLSWGERNAFALVLFMHYAQSQNADLVILDDPISSFDTNKKYAIINRLFLNHPSKKSLYKKTALMLTHDFQPVIDFIVNSKPNGGSANAAFLRNDSGAVIQTEIKEEDIRPFALLLSQNAARPDLNKVHRVTSLRKLLEHTKSNEDCKLEYNLLSCLLKGKPVPSFANGVHMTAAEIAEAEETIKEHIEDFEYEKYRSEVFNKDVLIDLYTTEDTDYFKLQVFRIIIETHDLRPRIDDPLLKYIDEQFHIENDYAFYLDYSKYNTVPSFVLPKCTEFLQKENLIS